VDDWGNCLEALAWLVEYPRGDVAGDARAAVEACEAVAPDLAPPLRAFAAFVAATSPSDLEEGFSRQFELNPTCALEIGWHLYGEEYLRGAFLVRMRAEQRAVGVEAGVELPDHLAAVLRLLARMELAPATDFARCCVIPALDTMRDKLADVASPYAALLGTIHAVLDRRYAVEEVAHG
jgi:nitrate reductase molybdenum cofactor assembly chaperone